MLLTHLMPRAVGQAPCRDCSDLPPSRSRLYQNTAVPALGLAATPRLGKAVKPPTRLER